MRDRGIEGGRRRREMQAIFRAAAKGLVVDGKLEEAAEVRKRARLHEWRDGWQAVTNVTEET